MDQRIFTYTEEELREIVLSMYPRIIAYIVGFSKGKLPAEDIFQDVLCRFIDRHPRIYADKVPAYIYRAVKNKCLNMLCRNSVEQFSVSINELSSSEWDTLAMLDFESRLSDNNTLPPPNLDEILRFSNELPEKTREIFLMSRFEGMTHKEISLQLGISTRAVEKHLSRSVSLYRKHFGLSK